MRFWLLDKIRSFQPDVELAAVKNVTLTEEYLADHFPEFPVLPGVFMLEAATQAGAWLLRLSENFAHSIISLKEAKNIKYADFVAPGQTLDVTVSMLKKDDRLATFKVEGQIDDRQTLSGRIVLERYNLVDRDPALRDTDEKIIQHFRRAQKLLLPRRWPLPPANRAPERTTYSEEYTAMSSVSSKSEIFSKVQEALVDALGVDEDEVTPQATLQGDLGAESIDFLDIVFRLEKAFGIKIERGELFPEDILTNTEYVEDGKVNAAGLTKLKERMPFADLTKFAADPSVQNLGKQLTVQDMCNFVEHKLAA